MKMINEKAKKVIERLQKIEEDNRTCAIKIIDNKENKIHALTILLHNREGFSSFGKDEYCGVSKQTLALFDEAEIKYKKI